MSNRPLLRGPATEGLSCHDSSTHLAAATSTAFTYKFRPEIKPSLKTTDRGGKPYWQTYVLQDEFARWCGGAEPSI